MPAHGIPMVLELAVSRMRIEGMIHRLVLHKGENGRSDYREVP